MSIIDKFLDVMRLNDDDYEFDNEDYDYDEEDEYEVKEKKPSRRERKKEEEQQQTAATFDISEKQRQKQQNKITPINRNRRQGQPGMEVCVIKPDLEVLFDLADLFKVFGDSTRIRIMFAISDNEMSVLSIAEALNMEQSTISHQLRVLRQNKLVRVRREGKQIYYTLDDDHVKKIIEMGLDHVLE